MKSTLTKAERQAKVATKRKRLELQAVVGEARVGVLKAQEAVDTAKDKLTSALKALKAHNNKD